MKQIRSIAILFLIPAWTLADEPVKKLVPVPAAVKFDLLKTQHMVVEVKINGKGPYRLIFDTGAPITLINNKVAKEAEVLPKDFKKPVFALFGSMGQFKIKEMEVGNLKVEGMSTMVMDHPTVEAISKALGPIEGIVGMSFFGKYRMTLDYKNKEMTFVPVKYEPPDMMQTMLKMVMGRSKDRAVLAPGGILGIQVDKAAGDEEPGVNVTAVLEGGPAAKAGFQAGDRLLTLDDRWTDSVVDCFYAASKLTPGRSAVAVILRKGKRVELKVATEAGL
ncbi:MAG: aspartyl protease family protein [Gemmataceae bacterium]